MRFNRLVNVILEAVADMPPPPAIIRKAEDTKLTFDDIKDLIQAHEGVRPHGYLDSRGIPTIGLGFNLLIPDAKDLLARVNANDDNIKNGTDDLNKEQIKKLFEMCMQIAYKDVKQYIPSFDNLPRNIKLGLLDMSFNLGYGRLSKFVKTKQFITSGDYKSAASELKNSKWATQVGKRAEKIISLFSAS